MTRTAEDGTVAEWEKYEYIESNRLIPEELYNRKKNEYTYNSESYNPNIERNPVNYRDPSGNVSVETIADVAS